MRISVRPEDRDFLRFLWTDGEKMGCWRFKKLIFGVADSPFLAIATVREHAKTFQKRFPKAAETILSYMYIDDLITSVDNEEEAVQLTCDIRELMQLAGMRLRKWASNAEKVIINIPTEDRLCQDKLVFASEDEVGCNALGFAIDCCKDLFTCKGLSGLTDSEETMTSVARIVGKFGYDPIGFYQQITLGARLVLKECFKAKLTWKDKLPPEIARLWQLWLSREEDMGSLVYPRFVGEFNGKSEIHVFGDASKDAFGACAYLWIKTREGWQSWLILSRAKIVPMKEMTIPNLELEAACLVTNVCSLLKDEYPYHSNQVHLWLDSHIVLWWLHKDPNELKVFQANRIRKIMNQFPREHWGYVRTNENPADIASRGGGPTDLMQDLWQQGPAWLQKDQKDWPIQPEIKVPEDKDNCLKMDFKCIFVSLKSGISFDLLERYSSLSKLITTTC